MTNNSATSGAYEYLDGAESRGPDVQGFDAQGRDAQGRDAQGRDAQGRDAQGPESQEQRRLAAVRRYQLIDQPLEDAYARIAFVAGAIFDTPIATVSMVEQDRVWLAACHGLTGVQQVGKEPGLCASVIAQDDVYVINDAAVDARTLEHPLVRGELGLRFYAAAPIRTHDGYRLGTVNVIDSRPREVAPRQVQALEHLASMVSDELELRLMVIRSATAEQRMRETVS